MVKKKVIINLKNGLQARSATHFVFEANRFLSEIFIEKGNKRLNGKSIIGLMSLALTPGSEVIISAEGRDEEEAVEKLEMLVSHEG